MKKIKSGLLIAAVSLAGAFSATVHADSLLTNSEVGVSYEMSDLKGGETYKGFGVKAAKQLDSNYFVKGSYTKFDASGFGSESKDDHTIQALVGKQFSVTDKSAVDVAVGAQLVADYDRLSGGENFAIASVEYKHLFTDDLMLKGGFDYKDLGDRNLKVKAGAEYRFMDSASVSFDYNSNTFSSGQETYMLSFNYKM